MADPAPEVVWTLRAEAHLLETYGQLEDRREEAGEDLFSEIDRILELIQNFPEMCRVFEAPVRRRIVGRGRYGLLDLRQDPKLIRRLLGLD